MATRNLTESYRAARAEIFSNRDTGRLGGQEDVSLVGEGQHSHSVTIAIDTIPPKWLRVVDEVKAIGDAIQERMETLRRLHKKHLKPKTFDNSVTDEEHEIQSETLAIKAKFKQAEELISLLTLPDDCNLSYDQRRVVKNVQLSLATNMSELSKTLRSDIRKYCAEVEKQKKRQGRLQQTVGGVTAEEVMNQEAIAEQREKTMEYMSKGFTAEQVEDILLNEKLVNERDSHLHAVYKGLTDVHEMFQDLNAHVIDQGTLLDRIDCNLQNTTARIKEGNKELDKAREIQKKSKFALLVMIMMLVIAAAVIGLMMKVLVF